MQRFLTRKASSEASDSGLSSSSPKYHHAAARSLKGKSPLCQTTAFNASTGIENAPNEPLSHEIPSNSEYYYGAVFAINWNPSIEALGSLMVIVLGIVLKISRSSLANVKLRRYSTMAQT
jgi:hypothetical protein